MWSAALQHLLDHPEDARFLQQVEASPYALDAHAHAMGVEDDPLLAEVTVPTWSTLLAPLPLEVLWDLGSVPRCARPPRANPLEPDDRPVLAHACWRAITAR